MATAAGDAAEQIDDEGQDVLTPTEAPVVPGVRTKKSQRSDEDVILAGIEERGQQSIALQERMLNMLKPSTVTERTTYADWSKSVMEDLDVTLWRRFQMEHSQMLYKYLELNDEIKARQVTQHPQPYQAPSQPYPYQPQYQSNSSSAMWQPAPQYWPATVQPGTSVWGSQSAEWVQNQTQPPQLTTLQPMKRQTATTTATSSTPQTSFNYSIPDVNASDITPFSTSFIERVTGMDKNDQE